MIQEPAASIDFSSEVFSFPGYFIFRRKDGIIHVQFDSGFNGGIEEARNQVRIIDQLRGERKALVLAVYADDNNFTREAREYIASDEVSAIVEADAFVVRGLGMRILGNGYLRINKPRRHARLFNAPAPAILWLGQFMK